MSDERVSAHGRRPVTLRYFAGTPPEVRAAIHGDLSGFADAVGLPLDELNVQSLDKPDPEDETACLTTVINTDYNAATIVVRPAFLAESPERRREFVLHELVHICHAPLDAHAVMLRNALEAEGGSKALLDWVDRQATRASEHTVSNVLRMVRALAPGAFAVRPAAKAKRRGRG